MSSERVIKFSICLRLALSATIESMNLSEMMKKYTIPDIYGLSYRENHPLQPQIQQN